ncbi:MULTISPECIES: MurR/RpiR family transcriptional regulator [Photobacterium]|uniref:Transcriptional regulator n=1 Tax=Photobacterium ganghwense TaxID=320778 RepID=A0A0J1HJ91_9GAMM|nr:MULTISPECIES: MurR/RpiR family transcriptional regulator [Photobacterium]KLV11665.1 transcriptional regulator [Photobacterium ganghwense]MBV1842329.1 MurR/RpiR family transcriptional regulator [Photobacterium ganghwense]PSU08678.1 MurR/RpiR family transcriptional regulator [Photobacterium ganghwense]QSV15188.1 MurR/RpiR family transcriptional regulator [Photobacterium ganghwense]
MTIEVDIVSRITERFSQLREAEKKVAMLVMDDLAAASGYSISQLAEEAGVSEATITRFAKAVGCKNVRDLKLKLAQSLALGQRFIHESPDQSGIQGVYESIKNVININRKVVNEQDVAQAVELLQNARQILAVGMGGGSTILSQELQYRLFRLGYAVTAYNDGLLARMVAATADSNDVMVVISATGYTPEVVEPASIAKQYGMSVIAITAKDSPLAEVSDLVLPIVTKETDFIYKPSASRYAMMAMIDVLSTELALSHKRRSRDKLRRLKMALDSHRGGEDRQPLGD